MFGFGLMNQSYMYNHPGLAAGQPDVIWINSCETINFPIQ